MKIILFGATGMIGKATLLECIDHSEVTKVLSIGRSALDISHPKLEHLVHSDFEDYSNIETKLQGFDACFFTLGVSAGGMKEADYKHITYDYTLAAAKTLVKLNPDMTFIYVSGQGTDSTEKGNMMWARVKGKTENDLLALGFKNALMYRPGAIIPERGIESRTPAYRTMYKYLTWLLKLIKAMAPKSMNTTTEIGLAMIHSVNSPPEAAIVTPKMIVDLAGLK